MPRPRLCKAPDCRERFVPRNSLQRACSPMCGIKDAIAQAAKRSRRQLREGRARLKTRGDWTGEAQRAFNQFVRLRDKDRECISCGVMNPPERFGGAWDCGHYRSVGAAPELRFEELNAHKQCKACNAGASKYARKGVTVTAEYRERLIQRIGLWPVGWLEGPHEPKKYTIDDLRAIRDKYRKLVRGMKNGDNR
jgi:hypothetical protein